MRNRLSGKEPPLAASLPALNALRQLFQAYFQRQGMAGFRPGRGTGLGGVWIASTLPVLQVWQSGAAVRKGSLLAPAPPIRSHCPWKDQCGDEVQLQPVTCFPSRSCSELAERLHHSASEEAGSPYHNLGETFSHLWKTLGGCSSPFHYPE